MPHPRRALGTLGVLLALTSLSETKTSAQKDGDAAGKPSLSLRTTPPAGFSPLKVRATVELRGGADDFADFYCPEVEWEWGDGTTSGSSEDCQPYVAGTSEIRRRYSIEHNYREVGQYRIVFRLKQRTRVVGSAIGAVQVRSGQGGF